LLFWHNQRVPVFQCFQLSHQQPPRRPPNPLLPRGCRPTRQWSPRPPRLPGGDRTDQRWGFWVGRNRDLICQKWVEHYRLRILSPRKVLNFRSFCPKMGWLHRVIIVFKDFFLILKSQQCRCPGSSRGTWKIGRSMTQLGYFLVKAVADCLEAKYHCAFL
jgi:hypothetical protein